MHKPVRSCHQKCDEMNKALLLVLGLKNQIILVFFLFRRPEDFFLQNKVFGGPGPYLILALCGKSFMIIMIIMIIMLFFKFQIQTYVKMERRVMETSGKNSVQTNIWKKYCKKCTKNAQKFTEMHRNAQKGTEMHRNAQKWTEMHRNAQKFTEMHQTVAKVA